MYFKPCAWYLGIPRGIRLATNPLTITLFNLGNGPNTVSESTVSNTELSEFSWPSPSSGERTE